MVASNEALQPPIAIQDKDTRFFYEESVVSEAHNFRGTTSIAPSEKSIRWRTGRRFLNDKILVGYSLTGRLKAAAVCTLQRETHNSE
jgi:hypothetical protein